MNDDTSMASNATNPLPQTMDDDTIDTNNTTDGNNTTVVQMKSIHDIFKQSYIPAFHESIGLMKKIVQFLIIALLVYLYILKK
jgi:hypothetical protein